jgi:hypothetical protein
LSQPRAITHIPELIIQCQDYKRLGKGIAIAKDLRINHPTNASIGSHIRNITKAPTTNARVI